MFEPRLFDSPDKLERMQVWLNDPMPSNATGPVINNYTITVDHLGLLRLVGLATGHPRFGETWLTTSPVWQFSDTGQQARTAGRWYLLANLHPIPDAVDGSDRSRAIYGDCLTLEQARTHLQKLRDAIEEASRSGQP